MTQIKPRAARALKEARERLRDVAAAAHSTASAARDQSARELAGEHQSLEAALDYAAQAMANVHTVHELDQIASVAGSYQLSVVEASERHAVAVAASQTTEDQLRERARQLRTAERLVEIVDDYRAKRDATAEQRSADDLAGRRR